MKSHAKWSLALGLLVTAAGAGIAVRCDREIHLVDGRIVADRPIIRAASAPAP